MGRICDRRRPIHDLPARCAHETPRTGCAINKGEGARDAWARGVQRLTSGVSRGGEGGATRSEGKQEQQRMQTVRRATRTRCVWALRRPVGQGERQGEDQGQGQARSAGEQPANPGAQRPRTPQGPAPAKTSPRGPYLTSAILAHIHDRDPPSQASQQAMLATHPPRARTPVHRAPSRLRQRPPPAQYPASTAFPRPSLPSPSTAPRCSSTRSHPPFLSPPSIPQHFFSHTVSLTPVVSVSHSLQATSPSVLLSSSLSPSSLRTLFLSPPSICSFTHP